MAYCSKEAHSCVEKAAMIGFVKMRILEPDINCSLRGNVLREVSMNLVLFFGMTFVYLYVWWKYHILSFDFVKYLQAMEADLANGLYPFFVSATLGTTGACGFDNLIEIGMKTVLTVLTIFNIF